MANVLYTSAVNHYHGIDASIQMQHTGEMHTRYKSAIRILSDCGILMDEMLGDKYSSTTEEVL